MPALTLTLPSPYTLLYHGQKEETMDAINIAVATPFSP